ncbi:MAG: hypothetical protein RL662_2438 [Bacteroidota bacterium]|jgi:PhnB protein
MVTLNPYLGFNGTCEVAFELYKSVFGGQFLDLLRFKDIPSEQPIPKSEHNKIMHISLPISNEVTLMGSDSMTCCGQSITCGDNVSIAISPESEAQAKLIYNTLSAGGKIHIALDKTFWGALFATFTDKFGISWMINYQFEKEQN